MPAPLPRLFLVDGSAYIFRAFFPMPALRNGAGLPTNVIFGFTNMMLRFLKQHRTESVVVALNASRQNFRNEMFARGSARMGKAFYGGTQEAFLDRAPATVKADVPIEIELESLGFSGSQQAKLRAFISQLEFTNPLDPVAQTR